MSNYINAVVLVDTERLLKKYPIGWNNGGPGDLDSYFEVLVSPEFACSDPSHPHSRGIRCEVGDFIAMRAFSKTDPGKSVIIYQFTDHNRNAPGTQIWDYLSRPEFLTATPAALKYTQDNPRSFPWAGWLINEQSTELDENQHDNFVSMSALQSTTGLEGGRIQYSLGFKIQNHSMWMSYGYDPFIKIEG